MKFKKGDVCMVVADKPVKKGENHPVKLETIMIVKQVTQGIEYPIYAENDKLSYVFRPCELVKIGRL